MNSMIFLLSPCTILVALITPLLSDDKIAEMPYYSGADVNFDTYGGYLTGKTGKMYYLFSESSNDPDTDPVVLWLNGGPGCSSLLGAFTELGPYHVTGTGDKLEYNPYSWNNFANMLFLEAPPCVGFSYPYTKDCENFETNDENTALNNYYALQSFFNKFPQYKHREFIITGESYAGHYVPTLTKRILEENEKISNGNSDLNFTNIINITAIGIGNPYTQRDNNFFEGWLPQMYAMGIASDAQRDYLLGGNCSNREYIGDCGYQINYFIYDHLSDINVYDVNVRANVCQKSDFIFFRTCCVFFSLFLVLWISSAVHYFYCLFNLCYVVLFCFVLLVHHNNI